MAYEKTVWVNGQAPALDAEHLNKIEQGIADAVSITPQTLTNEQQAQARENINAAPGGFGLGKSSGRTANSFSDITGYGFFRIPTESGFAPDTSTNWGGVYIGASLSYGTLLYARNNALMAVREVSGGEVGPIEWINPPMALGVEYMTTEHYLGKPVYTQVFKAFDSLAKGGSVYDAQIPNVSQIISCTGESGGWNLPSDVIGGEVAGTFIHIGTQRGSTAVQVYAITDRDSWPAPVYVTLRYTKTTD